MGTQMNRRDFMTLVGGAAAAWPLIATAQPAGKVVRIGLLSTSFLQRTAGVQAFRDRLEQLGYVEGRNLSVEIRDGQGRNDRLPAFAAELVGLPADIIVTLGPYAIQAAKDATTTIPVVFTGIGANFAFARSEGNLTGVVEELIESTAKRLALLKEAIPNLMRVGIIANPDNYGTRAYLQQCRAWAQATGATLQVYDVRDPNDIAPAFAKMVPDRIEAIVAFPDSVIFGQRDRIVQTALQNKLPGIYIYREWVTAGGLFAYGANQETILAGPVPNMVDKILKGAKPSDLPVEQGKLELFINVKSAKVIGITFPQSLLARANELIE
jgi:putative tryptophan/tyrosine transport system substrate-binding protein